jgi:hypothetical protein
MDSKGYLTDWLLKACAYRRSYEDSEGYHYVGVSDFLLQHGVWYLPVPFPAGIRKGRKKYCFRNAALLAIEQPQSFRYVEGYALYPGLRPMLHAWNIDKDGNLVDRTWKNCGTAYIGVVFSTARVITADGWCESAFYDLSILTKPWTGGRSPKS